MIRLALFVGIGGFLGSISRFFIYQFFIKIFPSITPLGTLVVNILGSFLLGILLHTTAKMDRDMHLLLTSGFCGGFTTFSAFSLENVGFLSEGFNSSSLIYTSLSLFLGIGAGFIGWYFGKIL
ncbi:MAG: fluoride efflux transporter CrcB [Reichenbachiella sp.]